MYLCILLSIQAHASSLQKAKTIVDVLPETDAILVGGKQYEPVQQSDVHSAFLLTNKNLEMEEAVLRGIGGIFVRSVFIPKHGHEGTLYRVGEHCLVTDENEDQHVIKLSHIFTINISGTYPIFVKGEVNLQVCDSNEVGQVHIYSNNPVVELTSVNKMFLGSQIQRKLMLYRDVTEGHFIVIDHQRPCSPLSPTDVAIPLYLETGDVIKVRGDNDEIWIAHIQSVNASTQSCQVHFYVENGNIYKGSPAGRTASIGILY